MTKWYVVRHQSYKQKWRTLNSQYETLEEAVHAASGILKGLTHEYVRVEIAKFEKEKLND